MDREDARSLLVARRAEIEALRAETADNLKPVALDQQSVGRVSRMDALQGQAMARASEQRRVVEIARIEAALKRLDDGSFGECLGCGEDIEARRLAVDPAATLCIDCARSR
jgi:RNA polymerase-binding transcription factor